MRFTIALAAGLGTMLCLHTPGMAATHSATAVPGFRQTERTKLAAGQHTVDTVYVNSNDPDITIDANTFTTLDEEVIKCSKPTCTLAISSMQQVGAADADGASWAIVVSLDGNFIDGGPFQGIISTAGYTVGNWQGQIPVSKGKHTITWQVFGQADFTMGQWADTATILVP